MKFGVLVFPGSNCDHDTYNVIAEDGTLEEGLSFLQKPFTPQVLTQKVRETLDRPVPAK